jgi:hypothetical protein
MSSISAMCIVILSLVASSANAQTTEQDPGLDSVNIYGSAYKLAPHEGDAYVGVYLFDSHQLLRVTNRGGRLYGEMDDRPAQPLVPLAAGRFALGFGSGRTLSFASNGSSVTYAGPPEQVVGNAR